MKTATLVTILTRLTTAMAIAAPLVVFGFLYVLRVQPERAAALETRQRLDAARSAMNGQRLFVGSPAAANEPSALDEFDARTAEGDRVGEVADALATLLRSPAVGGVSNLSIETGVSSEGPIDSIVGALSRNVIHTPMTVTFDARYEQIGRFFWNLRLLPTTFDLQSLELEPAGPAHAAVMRAKATLLVFHRRTGAARKPVPRPQMVDVITAPKWPLDPFATAHRADRAKAAVSAAPETPEPVVSSILFSSGRRIALIDGVIVRPGDRLRAGVVRSIERHAVVITAAAGQERRLEIERPVIHAARR